MEFILQPNLPEKRVNLMVVDGRISKEIELSLINKDIEILKTMSLNTVDKAISYHPDIMLHHIENRRIVYAKGIAIEFLKKLENYDFELIEGATDLNSKYPGDVAYNVARVGNIAFHNLKYTDSILKSELEKIGIKFVHVNQGYTKCSVAVINSKCIITSDKSIAKAALENDIEVLLIDASEGIILPGVSSGFFGGSTGLIDKKTFCITGNIEKLKSTDKIKSFLANRGMEIFSLSNNQVIDLGSLLPLGTCNIIS